MLLVLMLVVLMLVVPACACQVPIHSDTSGRRSGSLKASLVIMKINTLQPLKHRDTWLGGKCLQQFSQVVGV